MKYPDYVEVNGRKYKINTDFRYAIRCNQIAEDENIHDLERGLAIICTLFGKDSINHREDYEKLLELAKKYLLCGKELEDNKDKEPDMDFVKDMDYIEASFMSDFHIDLENTQMHWWKFMNLMNGLSNSEFGNCCVLNSVRNLRNLDTSKIEDANLRKQVEEDKKRVALNKTKTQKKEFTKEEIQNMEEFNRLINS